MTRDIVYILLCLWLCDGVCAGRPGADKATILFRPPRPRHPNTDRFIGSRRDDLLRDGFRQSAEDSDCSRLLEPERGSIAVVFKSRTVCVRLDRAADEVRAAYEVSGSPQHFLSRAQVHKACNGLCTSTYEDGAALVTDFNGVRYKFTTGGLFFERLPPDLDDFPIFSLTATIAILSVAIRSAHRKVWLCAQLILLFYCVSRPPAYKQYSFSPRPGRRSSRVQIHGYDLMNFSREVVRKGTENCAMYSCNAIESAVNLRYHTRCDVLNFRVIEVLHNNRTVILNWLKVLTAIWIAQNESYDRFVYFDRDLILNVDPIPLVGDKELVFPDLGGGHPDAAMFVSTRSSTGHDVNFFTEWLDHEKGETVRRDGGEEQEALLLIDEDRDVDTVAELYSFQCGRNAMNRAQCLFDGGFLSWNRRMFFAKLLFEWTWIAVKSYAPARFRSSMLPAFGGESRQTSPQLQSFATLLEALVYMRLFSAKAPKKIKCSAAATRAISQGSVDNPYQKTLTGFYSEGISRRGRSGWECFQMLEHDEEWSSRALTDLQSFALAHLLGIVMTKLLQCEVRAATESIAKHFTPGRAFLFALSFVNKKRRQIFFK